MVPFPSLYWVWRRIYGVEYPLYNNDKYRVTSPIRTTGFYWCTSDPLHLFSYPYKPLKMPNMESGERGDVGVDPSQVCVEGTVLRIEGEESCVENLVGNDCHHDVLETELWTPCPLSLDKNSRWFSVDWNPLVLYFEIYNSTTLKSQVKWWCYIR